jgi:putative flippase GtrA
MERGRGYEKQSHLNTRIHSLLQNNEIRRFVKFCLVGASGVLVNMFFLWFLTEKIKIYYLLSSLVAIEISLLSNYALNDLWTWHDRGKKGRVEYLKRMLQYHISSSAAILANLSILWILTELFHLYYLISNVFGILCGTFLNFFLNNRWTFKHKRE